jgi:nucleoside-diphosphate-sugar epimerase
LGHAALTALTARGHTIHATDRNYRKDSPVPIDVANLLDRDVCYRLVAGAEVLVHLGNHTGVGRGGAQEAYGENCTMNVNIMQAAVEVGVKKIIFASSIQVMGGNRHLHIKPTLPSALAYLPADGDMPANATNAYSLSKRSAEEMLDALARVEGLQTIALRLPLLLNADYRREMQRHPWNDYDKLDEAFAYLFTEDAGELIAAIAGADLPGFRIYLPSGTAPLRS